MQRRNLTADEDVLKKIELKTAEIETKLQEIKENEEGLKVVDMAEDKIQIEVDEQFIGAVTK